MEAQREAPKEVLDEKSASSSDFTPYMKAKRFGRKGDELEARFNEKKVKEPTESDGADIPCSSRQGGPRSSIMRQQPKMVYESNEERSNEQLLTRTGMGQTEKRTRSRGGSAEIGVSIVDRRLQ